MQATFCVTVQAVDVGDCVAVQAAIAAVSKERPIDVLLCNAGVVRTGYTEDTSHRHVEEQVRTNFLGTVFPVQAALPQMKARSATDPGAIVIMCSLSGLVRCCTVQYNLNLFVTIKTVFPVQAGLSQI